MQLRFGAWRPGGCGWALGVFLVSRDRTGEDGRHRLCRRGYLVAEVGGLRRLLLERESQGQESESFRGSA